MLSFRNAPDIDGLRAELGVELADYIAWRRRPDRRPGPIVIEDECALHEVIPYFRIPDAVELRQSLNGQLESAGWHTQIYCDGSTRYYARTYFDGTWTVDWIGEDWLANDIAQGIDWLDMQATDLPDSTVNLLSSRLFRFSSFWLPDRDGRHVVVSAPRYLQKALPLFAWLSADELANRLLEFYGPDHAKGGLRT